MKPMHLDPPEEIPSSSVHPGMSIGESIMQSVVYDVIDKKSAEVKESWLENGDGTFGQYHACGAGHIARHDPELFDEMTKEKDLIDLDEYNNNYNL